MKIPRIVELTRQSENPEVHKGVRTVLDPTGCEAEVHVDAQSLRLGPRSDAI
jgi:hypothetical protein